MKTAIFNFLILQIVIWTFVFSSGERPESSDISYASISDTWEVVKVDNSESNDVVMHYPTFNKLTLNPDGTYLRLKDDETLETGNWKINDEQSQLNLTNESEVKKYEIVQLPSLTTESFIIKEFKSNSSKGVDLKYELTRI